MKNEIHTLSCDGLTATVSADGAELQSLKNADGHELLWQAGQQWRAMHLCCFRLSAV
jgi:hypothetical protein